jgi:beta-lactam-binding protein with PASTA domain
MKITSSFIVYRFYTICLFFILININNTFADTKIGNNTDNGVVLELSTSATSNNEKTPIWDGYSPQSSTSTSREGYEKPIATIVPSAKNVIQGDVIYFRLQYENVGASFYWIMEDQRSSDRTLRIDTSALTLGKHRVRVSVTNKARQQASSQAFFDVIAKSTGRSSPSEAIIQQDQDTPVDYQGNTIESTANNSGKNSPAVVSEETTDVAIVPTILSVDQGEIASFKSSTTLSDDHQFHWRFGTQLADLNRFQVSTKDVIPGTYKVYLRVTSKEGSEQNITAQLIVKDPNMDKTNVPNLVGKNIEEADDELKAVELIKGIVEEKEVDENQGKIISQFPEAGTEVNINNKIYLVVGISAAIDVPNVIGKDVEDARSILDKNAFKIIIEKKGSNEKEGIVLVQSPTAGSALKQGESVKLVIAKAAIEKDDEAEDIKNPLVLEAAIETTASSVEQGTDVVFNALLKNTVDDESYTYLWEFGIQKSTKSEFTVNTDELALGKHAIKLHVKDSNDKTITREAELEIRAKRLLVPTLTNLSPEEAQKVIKKAGLLLGTIKKQQGDVEKATIKQQSPAFGEYVSPDQRINLVVIIPEEDKETNDPTRVDISFDKTSGKAGEAIVFTTKVTTKTTLSDIHYVYSINNVKKASVDTRFIWTPEVEGTYTISVTAYNEGGAIAKSESYILDIDTGWEKPIAKLLPKKIEIKRGDKAEFVSNSTYDLNSTLVYEWISSSGHSGNQKGFTIDTTALDAGEYDVTLTITDDKGSQSIVTAYLMVQEVLENVSNTSNIDKPSKETDIVQFSANSKGKEKLIITLNTSRQVAQIGQKIQFNMQVKPQVSPEALYYYQLGDKKRRQWMNTASFEHHYNSFGSYSVRAVVKQSGEVYYSDSVTIWVWSTWLLGFIGGVGFFLFTLIWWWTKRSHSSDVNSYNRESLYEENNKAEAIEEQIPLPQAQGKHDTAYDIVTEKREQNSVKSVLIKGVFQFILGILLSFIILYIILKLMGLV